MFDSNLVQIKTIFFMGIKGVVFIDINILLPKHFTNVTS